MKGLTKKYGANTVLDNVTFDVDTNEILCIIGLNGAGKTTLINVLTGVVKPSLGDAISKQIILFIV